jgi:hypothetical protein
MVAVGGMFVTSQRAIEAERFAAERARAQAVAGYLSLVVPWAATGYPPARLLSTANAIRTAGFWSGGLQVASGTTGLLSDTLALFPLPVAASGTLAKGTVRLERPGAGPIAVVPLLDPDRRKQAGWVATWGSLPDRRWELPALVLACLTLVAAGLARRFRLTALVPGILLATVLGLSVRATAREGTDATLFTARRLAEISSSPEGDRLPLNRIAPGLRWSIHRGVVTRDGEVRRRRTGAVLEATVVAGLAGGRVAEIAVVPRESLLTPVGITLIGWVILLGAGVALGARSGASPAR